MHFHGNYALEEMIEKANTIHNTIYDLYTSSTGTLDERYKSILVYTKPLLNELMTEFRKYFPKKLT